MLFILLNCIIESYKYTTTYQEMRKLKLKNLVKWVIFKKKGLISKAYPPAAAVSPAEGSWKYLASFTIHF